VRKPFIGPKALPTGEILPRHGLALFDTDLESAVDVDSAQLDSLGVTAPIALMTVGDFINVALYLRTWRDLKAYLDSRSSRCGSQIVELSESSAHSSPTTPPCETTFAGVRLELRTQKSSVLLASTFGERSAARDVERARASILEEFMEGITAVATSIFRRTRKICDKAR